MKREAGMASKCECECLYGCDACNPNFPTVAYASDERLVCPRCGYKFESSDLDYGGLCVPCMDAERVALSEID